MAERDRSKLASDRAKDSQRSTPRAVAARYDRKRRQIVIDLSSKLAISVCPEGVQGLENYKASDLDEIEITPSGLGIHFPRLDADVYVSGVLEGFLGSKEWMSSRRGRAGSQPQRQTRKAVVEARRGRAGRQKKRPRD